MDSFAAAAAHACPPGRASATVAAIRAVRRSVPGAALRGRAWTGRNCGKGVGVAAALLAGGGAGGGDSVRRRGAVVAEHCPLCGFRLRRPGGIRPLLQRARLPECRLHQLPYQREVLRDPPECGSGFPCLRRSRSQRPYHGRGSYTVATGTVTNVGVYTYEFVKLKGNVPGQFGYRAGYLLDLCGGGGGTGSGESATFRLSVPEDYRIRECSVSIIDCDTVL